MVFAHDGFRDHLTRLAAPPYFYESLRREISVSTRNQSTITVIRYLLQPEVQSSEISHFLIYDETLVNFADLIDNAFRLEDYKARLGENEFVVLIYGNEQLALQISQRLIARWTIEGTPGVGIVYSCTSHINGEASLDVMNRLDKRELLRSSF
jgi:GGDEF domain-containing protein